MDLVPFHPGAHDVRATCDNKSVQMQFDVGTAKYHLNKRRFNAGDRIGAKARLSEKAGGMCRTAENAHSRLPHFLKAYLFTELFVCFIKQLRQYV